MRPAFLIPALLLLCAPRPARAETEVHIKLAGGAQGASNLPLGLPPFLADDASRKEDSLLAKQAYEVVREDLLFSRHFRVVEGGPSWLGDEPAELLEGWKNREAGWILLVKASLRADKAFLHARLFDLRAGETTFERTYRQDARFTRSAAHRLADDVVQALTGKTGIAHTQLAFVNDKSGAKEVHLMDYDGHNLRQLTRHGSIALLPRLSPDRRFVVYTSYANGNPDLFKLDLETGRWQEFSAEQGLNIAGGFSPDGGQLLMTLSRQKSPNLYVKNLVDGSVTQLTRHFGADSSPTFSPDGVQVAFVSDRSGNPQIYVLDTDTLQAKRLTSLNWCDSPAWSPTGEWIAFAGRVHPKDKMDIYLVDLTGNQIRQLTRGEGSNENPTWSPDGRFLAFTSTRRGRSEVFVMDSDGSAPHPLAEIPGRSFTPNWSR